MDHNIYLHKNNKSFNKQLDTTEIIKLHTSFNNHTKHNINYNTQHETQSNCSQQALKKSCKNICTEGNIRQKVLELNFNFKDIWGLNSQHS